MNEIRFRQNEKSRKREQLKTVAFLLVSFSLIVYGFLSQANWIVLLFTVNSLMGIYLLVKSFSMAETVIVSVDGISSNVNGMGLIRWDFIEGFQITQGVNANFLVVNLNDGDKLLNEMNYFSRKLMNSNVKKFGSPVIFPQSQFHESLEIVKTQMENYKDQLEQNVKSD